MINEDSSICGTIYLSIKIPKIFNNNVVVYSEENKLKELIDKISEKLKTQNINTNQIIEKKFA